MTAVIDYRTSGALEFLILDATAGGDETTEGGLDQQHLTLNVEQQQSSGHPFTGKEVRKARRLGRG